VSQRAAADLRARIDRLYRSESRRVLATLIRLLGDFDLAEEALQDAFAAAIEQWPGDGIPAKPRAWLISTGRFKAIDRLRRRSRFDVMLGELAARLDSQAAFDPAERDDQSVEDDRLRLIFTAAIRPCRPTPRWR
jgi:RNA polymerase sigma-70 factor, ECF subfamily